MGSMIKAFFVVTVVLLVGYYVSLGVLAVKALNAFEEDCKGSVGYCLGKATKSFEQGLKEAEQEFEQGAQ
jgi:hypothetical protein